MKKRTNNKKVTLDELLNVLSFYADKENYHRYYRRGIEKIAVDEDYGSKARKILKKLVKETLEKERIENNL